MNIEEPTQQITQNDTGNVGNVGPLSMESQTPHFMGLIPENIRSLPFMDGVSDQESFFAKIIDTVNSAHVPEEYTFKSSDDIGITNDLLDQFISVARSVKLTQDQAEGIMTLWEDVQKKELLVKDEMLTKGAAELQNEWGKQYNSNMKIAKKAVAHFGGPDLVEYLNKSGLGNNVQLIKTFKTIGEVLGEDSTIGFNADKKPVEIDRWNGLPLLNFKM